MTLLVSQLGCTRAYYALWEALGKQKRDLLRDRIEELAEDQKNVHEDFRDALSKLQSLYGTPSSELNSAFERLRSDYDQAKSRSEALSHRIVKVESVAQDLFSEWESEISKLKTPKYSQGSRQKLRDTKVRFAKLQVTMHKTEKDLAPVLSALEEQVIFLKHNLNAQALGSLQGEALSIEGDFKSLSLSIHKSISESQIFLSNLR